MANGINTIENFKNARRQFISTQGKERQSAIKSLPACKEKSIALAVNWGYADAARNMVGIKDCKDIKEEALAEIAKGIKEYFEKPAHEDYADFNEEHRTICDIWIRKFKGVNSELAYYGKAQKIVNMAFKYLYCFEGADKYRDYFAFCHVPLDSYTLKWFCHEWFYRLTKEKGMEVNEDAMPKWSKIKDYDRGIFTYMFFQDLFYEWHENENITPLQAEFIYWPLVK